MLLNIKKPLGKEIYRNLLPFKQKSSVVSLCEEIKDSQQIQFTDLLY